MKPAYNLALLFSSLLLINSCTDNGKSDEALYQRDLETLNEKLDCYAVAIYKIAKIAVRSSITEDTISAEFQSFKSDLNWIDEHFFQRNVKERKEPTLFDYTVAYQKFLNMKKFVTETDEDIFPTFSEVTYALNAENKNKRKTLLQGEEKARQQSSEHFAFAIFTTFKGLGPQIGLYEISKTKPELYKDSEDKSWIQFLRGYYFLGNGLSYLAEKEFTDNITWLEANKNAKLPGTANLLKLFRKKDKDAYPFVHGINHVFRGMARMFMKRDIDQDRALEDFEIFLEDIKSIGMDGEMVWIVEVYVYVKKEDFPNAISTLKKLKKSKLLGADEKEVIDEAIEYLENKKPDQVLSKVYDNIFMTKLAVKYFSAKLTELEWNILLEQMNVPYVKESYSLMERISEFQKNLMKYTTSEQIDETTNDLKERGEEYWDKLKNVVN